MYLWERLASRRWFATNARKLESQLGNRLVVIERPGRKRLRLEAACSTRALSRKAQNEFGGRTTKLPTDWLHRFTRERKTKPLKIGRRLQINVGGTSTSRRTGRNTPSLTIPAGAAFGTGDHITTALSLRLLEEMTRAWKPGWSLVDLGTGTGILALAATRLGADRVIGIDIDPLAVSTATENARRNKIKNVRIERGDVRSWKFPRNIDVITANLFSELLVEILSRLKRSRWLILSGVLRKQEPELSRALKRNRIDVAMTRRRGKWIALLAKTRRPGA